MLSDLESEVENSPNVIPRTPIELRPQTQSKSKAKASVSRNLLQSFSRDLKRYYDVNKSTTPSSSSSSSRTINSTSPVNHQPRGLDLQLLVIIIGILVQVTMPRLSATLLRVRSWTRLEVLWHNYYYHWLSYYSLGFVQPVISNCTSSIIYKPTLVVNTLCANVDYVCRRYRNATGNIEGSEVQIYKPN